MATGDVQEPARLRTRWVFLLSEGSMRWLRPSIRANRTRRRWDQERGSPSPAILEAQNKRRYREGCGGCGDRRGYVGQGQHQNAVSEPTSDQSLFVTGFVTRIVTKLTCRKSLWLLALRVEDRGLEPLTSCMPCKRSPN